MDRRESYDHADELKLIQAVINEEPAAWEAFLQLSGIVCTQCTKVFSSDQVDFEHVRVIRVLQANPFAFLGGYGRRAAFKTFLHFKLREILGQHILELFTEQPALAWKAFQHFPQQLLDPLKKRDEDLYQEVCLWLIDNNYRPHIGLRQSREFLPYSKGHRSWGSRSVSALRMDCVLLLFFI